jgi:hypothetical protein
MRGEDRFPPVTVRGIRRIEQEASGTGMFMMAAALGRAMRSDGTFGPIGPGGRPTCVVVSMQTRDRVLESLGRHRKTWEDHARRWVDTRMAHRCAKGTLCLFLEPQDGSAAACLACSKALGTIPPGLVTPARKEGDTRQGLTQTSLSSSVNASVGGGFNGDKEGGLVTADEPITVELAKEILQSRPSEIAPFDEEAALELVKRVLGEEKP